MPPLNLKVDNSETESVSVLALTLLQSILKAMKKCSKARMLIQENVAKAFIQS